MLLLSDVYNKEKHNGSQCENDKNTRCNPMGNSLSIPILNTVAESKRNGAHTEKAENTKNIKKLVFVIVLSVHKLCVENNASRGEDAPEPEEDFSVLTKKWKSAELTCRIISPTEGENKTVHKSYSNWNNASDFQSWIRLFYFFKFLSGFEQKCTKEILTKLYVLFYFVRDQGYYV